MEQNAGYTLVHVRMTRAAGVMSRIRTLCVCVCVYSFTAEYFMLLTLDTPFTSPVHTTTSHSQGTPPLPPPAAAALPQGPSSSPTPTLPPPSSPIDPAALADTPADTQRLQDLKEKKQQALEADQRAAKLRSHTHDLLGRFAELSVTSEQRAQDEYESKLKRLERSSAALKEGLVGGRARGDGGHKGGVVGLHAGVKRVGKV